MTTACSAEWSAGQIEPVASPIPTPWGICGINASFWGFPLSCPSCRGFKSWITDVSTRVIVGAAKTAVITTSPPHLTVVTQAATCGGVIGMVDVGGGVCDRISTVNAAVPAPTGRYGVSWFTYAWNH